ncbi:MAG TPA: hypothetical protein VFJ14_12840 [Nocardioidaceae bacterium]|nr:hypothetical protein [Nocardioidaceae bacterium]
MATIQVREVPDDAYEVIRSRAAAAGQSLQAYMRDRVIEMAATPSKAEALERIEAALARFGGASSSREQIVDDVHADRR